MTVTALATRQEGGLALPEAELLEVLESSLYPGASEGSIKMVIGYCRAAGLDPMQKPVHIVPVWDSKAQRMRDVVMPGVGLYRTQASRSGACAGIGEPEFGPDITETIGGVSITYPAWCRVVVRRRLPTGEIAEFTAKEFWKENYAAKGGKEKSVAPNAMWSKRPYGQLAKCAEAQALRRAFPEIGAAPTAEEMAGKALQEFDAEPEPTEARKPPVEMPRRRADIEDATVVDAPRATQTEAADAPCSKGEIAYITKKLASHTITIAEARERLGMGEGDTLEGLTRSGFLKLREALA